MPRIPEFTNQQQLDPSSLGSAAQAVQVGAYESGQNIRQGFNAVAQGVDVVEQHVAQNETTKLAADLATTQAQLSAEWSDTVAKADPNDHELASRFMEQRVQPALDKLGDGLLTQQAQNMYTKAAAGVRADLFTKSTADQMNLAGEAAISNLDTMKNQISSAVASDPSNWTQSISLANTTIDGMVQSFNLPQSAAIKLRQQVLGEIAKSAAVGMIEKNPAAGKAALERGDFNDYIDGTTKKTLSGYADSQQKAAENEEKAAEAEQRRQQKEQFTTALSQVQASTVDDKGNVVIPPDFFKSLAKLSQMPGADPSAIRATENMGRAVLREQEKGKPAVTDPAYYSDFSTRAFLPDNDPHKLTMTEVDQARANGHLSDKDRTFFRSALSDQAKNPQQTADMKDLNAYTKSLKGFISKSSFLNTDAYGDQRYYEFQSNATALYQQMKGQGKSMDDIKNAIRASLPHYQITKGQNMKAIQDRATGNLSPLPAVNSQKRQPGESVEAYLKRTGG